MNVVSICSFLVTYLLHEASFHAYLPSVYLLWFDFCFYRAREAGDTVITSTLWCRRTDCATVAVVLPTAASAPSVPMSTQ